MVRLLFTCLCFASLFSMTVEEKIGQMLMVHFRGQEINDDARRLMDEAHVGGFIYYNCFNGALPMQTVQSLSSDLQKYSQCLLLIAVDQEGGRVQRLKKGFTHMPPPCRMDNPYEMGRVVGRELKAAGVNLNLAPVVESYLGDRSQKGAQWFIDGMQQSGILACAKHYPGHGKKTIDSHFGLPVTEKLAPFPIGSVDLVMTAHVLVPSVDPNFCATLSKIWISRLRKKFHGVVITDSLPMAGVLQNAKNLKRAAHLAIEAGVDILLFGGTQLVGSSTIEALDPEELIDLHRSLVEDVRAGILDETLIDCRGKNSKTQGTIADKDRIW